MSQLEQELQRRLDAARSHRRALIRALRATLLFHSPSPWTPEKRDEWAQLTGATEATTRVLCDFIRAQLEALPESESF